jgi:hypothetical protein
MSVLMTDARACKIVDRIMGDLTGRKGFDWVWDDLDEPTQDEIRESLIKIVKEEG